MKVTVCELRNEPDDFVLDWKELVRHVKAEKSNLVLLPEMTFYPWFAWKRQFNSNVWKAAVAAHVEWAIRLQELQPAIVCASRPVSKGGKYKNQRRERMRSGSKPMMRRKFLKKGVASSALLAALPLKKLISFRAFFSDSHLKPEQDPSAESLERFPEVVLKYESELGDIHVDNI